MNLPADQSGFWNQAATRKTFTHTLDIARLARSVGVDAPILDYGCGQGRLCAELAQHGYQDVLGVDFSEGMIQQARQQHPGLRFQVVDGRSIPLADDSVAAVLLFAVLTCIPSDSDQQQLIADISRVLRPGGLLVISDYPLQSDARNRERYARHAQEFDAYGTFRLPDGAAVRHHDAAWLDTLLAGFAVDQKSELDAVTMNGNPARIVQIWARKSPV